MSGPSQVDWSFKGKPVFLLDRDLIEMYFLMHEGTQDEDGILLHG